MSGKLCPKVILEGTRLTSKTDLAFLLNQHPRLVGPRQYAYHSPLISAEWCAFSNVPWGRGLVNYQPDEENRAMETYGTWLRLFELLPYYSWIIDRFHVSTRAWQRHAGQHDPDFSWLDQRLLPLGFRHVLCTRKAETFEAARAARLKVSGKPSQYDDLEVFIREQEHYRKLVRESSLPWIEIDVSDGDLAGAANRIADWLEETHGLEAPWQ